MEKEYIPDDLSSSLLFCGTIIGRSLLVYGFGLAALRLGKSRTLSQATAVDAILALILGSVLARGIVGSIPLHTIFIASATLVLAHWILSRMSARSHRIGELVKGHVRRLVTNGVVDWNNMQKSHLSEHDLLEEMRLNANVEDLSQVAAAYKERNGAIGVVCKPAAPKVIEISVQDGVQTVRIVIEH